MTRQEIRFITSLIVNLLKEDFGKISSRRKLTVLRQPHYSLHYRDRDLAKTKL